MKFCCEPNIETVSVLKPMLVSAFFNDFFDRSNGISSLTTSVLTLTGSSSIVACMVTFSIDATFRPSPNLKFVELGSFVTFSHPHLITFPRSSQSTSFWIQYLSHLSQEQPHLTPLQSIVAWIVVYETRIGKALLLLYYLWNFCEGYQGNHFPNDW